jgi:transposase
MAKTIGKYIVRLTAKEREYLIGLTKSGKIAAKKLNHARILLLSDVSEAGQKLRDEAIAKLEHVSTKTVARVRELCVEEGLEAALNRKAHSRTKPRALDGEQEAKLIAICCSEPPEGRARWTLKLLSTRLVELEIVESIAKDTVRLTLKKMNLSLG